jgi:hypothetical protein
VFLGAELRRWSDIQPLGSACLGNSTQNFLCNNYWSHGADLDSVSRNRGGRTEQPAAPGIRSRGDRPKQRSMYRLLSIRVRAWLKATPIPPDHQIWWRTSELDEHTRAVLATILEEAAAGPGVKTETDARSATIKPRASIRQRSTRRA